MSSFIDKAGEKIPDSVKETASNLGDKAGDLVDKVKDKLHIGGSDGATQVPDSSATTSAPAAPQAPSDPTPETSVTP